MPRNLAYMYEAQANINSADKYLPALKCLNALEALDAKHPAIKDQSSRLRAALTPMPEDVPEQARETLQAEFLSKQ